MKAVSLLSTDEQPDMLEWARAIAPEISAASKRPWDVRRPGALFDPSGGPVHFAEIVSHRQLIIALFRETAAGQETRIRASARWPRCWIPGHGDVGREIDPRPYTPDMPSPPLRVTVAASRGPAALASAIRTRLLPEYLRWHPSAWERYIQERDDTLERVGDIQEIASVLGVTLSAEQLKSEAPEVRFYDDATESSGVVQARWGAVEFKRLSVPSATALKIARIIAEDLRLHRKETR